MDAQTLLRQVVETMSVRRAFGEPIEKNGIVVIPVAFVAGGGGGGEGPVTAPDSRAQTGEAATTGPVDATPTMGSGGGLGGVVIPLGVYVVKGDEVRWKPVLQPMLFALPALGLLRLIVKLRSRALARGR